MKIESLLTLVFVALCMSPVSCSHGDTGEGNEHVHDATIQITGYSNSLEVYAESSPLVAGEPAELLVHVTDLQDFKPVSGATVTVSLAVGDRGVRSTATPHAPGIYEVSLTPKVAGRATMVFDVKWDGGTSRVVVEGPEVFADGHEAHEAADEAAPSSDNGAKFSKEMSWKIDFSTAEAVQRRMGQTIHTTGVVEPSQGAVRTVTAPVAGTVTIVPQPLAAGTVVGAGQVLFAIDASVTPDNNLQARQLQARNDLNAAQREYDRIKALYDKQLSTQAELNTALHTLDNARVAYNSLAGSFGGGRASVTAPIGGYVTALDVTNGQYVEAGQTLATVAHDRDLYIKAGVAPRYHGLLSQIDGATLRPMSADVPVTLADLNGTVVSYGNGTAPGSTLVPVTMRIDNRAGFVPGTFVDMYITTAGDNAPTVTAVPSGAVMEEMGETFVFVQLTPEFFEKTPVVTGRTDGVYTQIVKGLHPGDRVVDRGAVMVKLAQGSGSLDPHAGHVH